MAEQPPLEIQPSRGRKIFATIVVIGVVLCVWKMIDYRTQPPPPPNPVGARALPQP